MHETIEIQALRKKGFRLTHQRRLIIDYVKIQSTHVTAEDVYAAVSLHCPEMNIATVYRNLQWLHSVGLLHTFDISSGRREYEYVGTSVHHHLVCKGCGAEQEIDNHVMDCFAAHVLEHYGFEADPEHQAIVGRCATCRKTNSSDTPTPSGPDANKGHS